MIMLLFAPTSILPVFINQRCSIAISPWAEGIVLQVDYVILLLIVHAKRAKVCNYTTTLEGEGID